MAERGDAQMIDNDQRERPSEFARRRRRHRQMRRRLMMAGKQLVESDDWHQRQQTPTMTSDNHRIGHRTGAPLMSMSMPMPSSDLAAEEIDAQLTRLRLHDELSRSGGNIASAAGQPTSASMRMLTSQAEMQQQQQQRRQRELDDRLGGSGAGAVVVAATTAEYNRDQPTAAHSQQLVGEQQQQQQQVPLLVDSAANQYHDHLSITNTNQNQYQHHDQYSGSVADAQQQVAFFPHQHQQQGGVGYLLEDPHQLAADDASPLTSLLDLDEGAHNQLGYSHTSHQQQQQLKQEQTGGRLPASVIQVNNWHERKLSAQYDHYYGASSGSGGRLHSRADAAAGQSVELTTLNSVAAASSDRSQQQQQQQPQHLVVHHPTGGSHHLHPMNTQAGQHRRNDSMSSFNLSLNESTGSMLGPGSAVAYSGEQLECFGPTTAGALVGHDQLYEDDEDEPQFSQSKSYSAGARTRHRTATRASSGQSRGRRQQQAGTPTNSDDADEFKVCEWHGCGNSFLEMRDFVRHLEERHVNMEPAEKNRFFCMWAECKRNNQEFNARYKLLIHMRVHSGEKPFTCDQSPHCKKSFSRLENLKIHKRSHTGEKPYRCNYEHCSKSFTNSSDRIKHHKTHKDPKPYTCTHEGCTKRYTDPSSLRKHLRAHKRHSDGPEVMNHRHLHTSSSSSSAAHNHYPPQVGHQNHLESYQPHHSHQYQHHQELSFSASYQTAREHMTPPQQQQLQPVDNYAQQQQQYSFGDQPSYASESYTTLEPKHMYEQQQQQQQPYLQADYDPAKEFESVLLNANDASSTLAQQEDQLGASFKRPQHRTDSTICGQSEQQQQQQQHGPTSYLAIPTRSPTVSQRSFSEAQARQHERLSRSWCAGNSARPAPAARRQHLVPSGASSSSQHPSNQNQYHIKPDHFGPQAQPCEWPSVGGQHNQQQVPVGQSFAPCDYQMTQQQQPPPGAANQQQHSWPTSSHYDGQVVARTSQRVQFQPHQQQQQQQQSRHMTRQQQHEQLMRSMPANVNFL